MKTKLLIFLLSFLVIEVNAQQNSTSGDLYFRFDGESIDPKQWYFTTPTVGGIVYQDAYYYGYPCLLSSSVEPSLRTIDKTVFTTVPISQLSQYDVMTIQDFCQRCATTGSAQAQNAWLKPYFLNYPNYRIFIVHINQASQTAKIVQVKWDAWE